MHLRAQRTACAAQTGLGCDEDVVREEVCWLLKSVDQVSAVQVVCRLDRPVHPGDKLIIVGCQWYRVLHQSTFTGVDGRVNGGKIFEQSKGLWVISWLRGVDVARKLCSG